MFRVSVCYDHPNDPPVFDEHYATVHLPLVRKIPGLVDFTAGRCHSLAPGRPAKYYMVAQLNFASAEDLATALNSPEMVATAADLTHFASAGVTTYWSEDLVPGRRLPADENSTIEGKEIACQ
ncbi:EthD family reductase [Nocardia aobensis]|uniref:EthD family reductase n=1 Tax=Nocardia aobensis TaxID=257277 RepID=A0ABW6PEF5_9NOCA|nr:EthD family reductase [Nocardia elegans]MBF6451073.1 EthD family reductase [Nocardia elegans]